MGRKEEHEFFVRNITFSSSLEVFYVITSIAVFILIDGLVRCLLRLRGVSWDSFDGERETEQIRISFFVDLLSLVLPMLSLITVFSEYLPVVLFAVCFIACGFIWYIPSFVEAVDKNKSPVQRKFPNLPKVGPAQRINQSSGSRKLESIERVIISQYRGTILLLTCMTILAVDFRIFPRWMAKTEISGCSLMDIGVGAFVVANALVAPQAKEQTRSARNSLWKEVKDSAILMLLGCGRFVSVTVTDYQAPEAEYGRHWNFFCTLAFVKIFGRIAAILVHPKHLYLMGLGLLAVYDMTLQAGLYDFMENSAAIPDSFRNTIPTLFFLQNLSGIFSCVGFLALFLIWTHEARAFQIERTMKELVDYGVKRGLVSVALMLVLQFCRLPSRRLANAPYVLWTTYFALLFLSLTVLFRILLISLDYYIQRVDHKPLPSNRPGFTEFYNVLCASVSGNRWASACSLSPDLLSSINFNAMPLFLIANVVTGLINLTTDTMQHGSVSSLTVLLAYVICLSCIATLLYGCNLKIPLRIPVFLRKKAPSSSI